VHSYLPADGGTDGYECVELISSPAVTHVRLERVVSEV
jgi:hypothetical protein